MRILAPCAVAVLLLQPVLQTSPQAAATQAPAAQTPTAPAAATTSKVWIGRYEEYEKFLQTAQIVKTDEIGTGVTVPRRAYFAPGGLASRAIIKDINDQSIEKTWIDTYLNEIAAYKLDRVLQLDMVPPTVERRVEGETRSMQLWVENCRSLKSVSKDPKPDIDLWNEQVYRHRVFDDLIMNIDRNEGNMLIDPVWNLILIDHSRTFDPRKDKLPFELTKIDRPLFERLQKMDKKTLEDAGLRRYITLGGVDPILKRRDRIVKIFQDLIKKNGEANVLLDWKPLPGTPTTSGSSR